MHWLDSAWGSGLRYLAASVLLLTINPTRKTAAKQPVVRTMDFLDAGRKLLVFLLPSDGGNPTTSTSFFRRSTCHIKYIDFF